jgi:hypothetical protein
MVLVVFPVASMRPALRRAGIAKTRRGAFYRKYGFNKAGPADHVKGLVKEYPTVAIEGHKAVPRRTNYAVYFGAEEIRRMPDGRELRLFRGITDAREPALAESQGSVDSAKADRPYLLETDSDRGAAVVRSISPDGSVFEVEIR